MPMIVRYNPFNDAMRRWSAFNRLMMRPAWDMTNMRSLIAPMNLTENEKGFEVRVQVPGLKPEDIEVTVQENTLTVKGHYQNSRQQQGEEKQGRVREMSSGFVKRSITFPKPW